MSYYNTDINGHVRIDDLVFSLTRQCNAFCDICCNDDGPQKRGCIDITNARKWIEDFSNYVPYCKTAGFTGGEVFLRYHEMLQLHKYLFEFGFTTSVTTNGFWGKNVNKAIERINELKEYGLTEMAVSIDPSHIPWVPLKDSTRAVKVAVACGLTVAVTSHFYGDTGSAKDYFEPIWHDSILWDESHYVFQLEGRKTFAEKLLILFQPFFTAQKFKW